MAVFDTEKVNQLFAPFIPMCQLHGKELQIFCCYINTFYTPDSVLAFESWSWGKLILN